MLEVLRGPRPGRRRLVVALAAAVVLAVLVGFAVHAVREARRSPLQKALDVVPAGSLRIGFTDWAAVRARLRPSGLGTDAGVSRFMDRAYDADLSAASSIDSAAPALAEHYGFSPVNADWEAYAQSRKGAVMVLKMPDSVDFDTLASRLSKLGYEKPSSDDGVWLGGVRLVAGIDPTITPELQYVVLDRGRHLVVTSDTSAYARTSEQVVQGKASSLSDTGLASLAGRVREPGAAFLWRAGFACEDLSMSQADAGDRAEGDRLVSAAGGVDSLDGLVETLGTDRRLQVAFGFEDGNQAKANLRPRARLFVGATPGREQPFTDDLTLTRSRTDGSAVLFDLRVKKDADAPLSAISQGPVFFATC